MTVIMPSPKQQTFDVYWTITVRLSKFLLIPYAERRITPYYMNSWWLPTAQTKRISPPLASDDVLIQTLTLNNLIPTLVSCFLSCFALRLVVGVIVLLLRSAYVHRINYWLEIKHIFRNQNKGRSALHDRGAIKKWTDVYPFHLTLFFTNKKLS